MADTQQHPSALSCLSVTAFPPYSVLFSEMIYHTTFCHTHRCGVYGSWASLSTNSCNAAIRQHNPRLGFYFLATVTIPLLHGLTSQLYTSSDCSTEYFKAPCEDHWHRQDLRSVCFIWGHLGERRTGRDGKEGTDISWQNVSRARPPSISSAVTVIYVSWWAI